jgi:hypothetical protein
MKPKTLQSQLRDVALEYMRKVADLLGRDSRECHWVGTDDNECGIYTICDFGDITFLTLDQMQVIIDRLPDWLRRYGTTKAVAQEIDDWMEWSIEDGYDPDRDKYRRHARINLWSWLSGLRPADLKVTVDDEIQQHRDILSVLCTVRGFYGNITVVQAIDNIQARLTELEARKRIEDESAFEKIKDTEAYKHFRKMMEDEA